MVDSSLTNAQFNTEIFLRSDDFTRDALWARVDDARAAGQSIWLTGQQFELLLRNFGTSFAGEEWLLIPAHSSSVLDIIARVRDLILCAFALILLTPVFVIFALLIKRSSPGPVFYATEVIGKGQQHFVWRKFRSMRVVAAQQDNVQRKTQFREYAQGKRAGKVIDDARVTPFGKFIRKYSLDELPQLWNVLRGEMALVGPRPCLQYEAELFPQWALRRFSVRPGLTGIWQVLGRSRVSLEDGLMMDVYYTYARTIWLDLKLIWLTFSVVMSGAGGH